MWGWVRTRVERRWVVLDRDPTDGTGKNSEEVRLTLLGSKEVDRSLPTESSGRLRRTPDDQTSPSTGVGFLLSSKQKDTKGTRGGRSGARR